ncbi:membrane protein [hydrothermal vent metagenome]|uniref:Membrane protein n=1 Tax=hydrothermal vent metagenome TaxID=652676 RepID=A0A1W1BNY6_9ZZZZ
MKVLFKKLGVLFALLLINSSFLLASENTNVSTSSSSVPKVININSRFILAGKELIDPRTIQKIDEMGKELFEKTGVNVYIYAKKSYLSAKTKDKKEKFLQIKEHEKRILENVKQPYVLISMAIDDMHVNILNSKDLNSVISRDKILDRDIIPILASQDKNSLYTKVSVALLNGYGEIADEVAMKLKGITLKSSIESGASTFKIFWRYFMYTLVLLGLFAYIYSIRKGRKN